MNNRLQVLQSDMDRCTQELLFLGVDAGEMGGIGTQGQYTMLDYRNQKIPVSYKNLSNFQIDKYFY